MKKINLFIVAGMASFALFSSCACSKIFNFKPKQFVPENYTTTVKAGASIEAEYLAMGNYGISMFETDVPDDFKKIVVYYPSDMTQGKRQYPVVVFVNGTGVKASNYIALFEHLASWGFIVVGNEETESWDGAASEKSLAWLLSENDNPESLFYRKVDRENIGASGHSQGGSGVFTTITEHEHSNMFKTAVSLSPTHEEQAISLKWHYDLTRIKIPILMLAGTEGFFETTVVIPLEKMLAMYEKISSPKAMARRTGAEHGEMLYSADGYVTAWLMWQLQGDTHAAGAFTGDSPEILTNKLYQQQSIDL